MSIQRHVEEARRDDGLVLVEGVHAIKHALRFGAELHQVWSPDPIAFEELLTEVAPDVTITVPVVAVEEGTWRSATRGGLPSPGLAIASRPGIDAVEVASRPGDHPVVLLEEPTHLGNIGAAVRVAAAAGADAVLTTGDSDPWHPRAVRAAAGLHFAVPVSRIHELPTTRPLVAVDPDGDDPASPELPSGAIMAFGTERGGLSETMRAAASMTVSIPMTRGVSSLNLATAVAVALYARRA